MLKKLKIGQIMDSFWILLFLLAASGFMLFKMGLPCIKALMGPAPLTAEAELSEMEGSYVSWEVICPVAEYMETTKTTKVNGVSTGEKPYRSSWLVIDEERGICLSVEIPAKRYDEMERQSDRFFNALNTGSDLPAPGMSISGSLEILTGEDLDYFEEAADYMEFPMEPVIYHISDGKINGEPLMNIYGISALGMFFLLLLVFILFKTLKNSPKKLTGEYLAANPSVTMEQLESDFAMAQEVHKVFIGRNWTFCPKLNKLLFDNSQVIWVHAASVRSGRSVNFYVYWEMLDGTQHKASFSSEKKCREILEKYEQFPHIVVGNSPEYGYMLQNDREAFLNLKYRNPQNL